MATTKTKTIYNSRAWKLCREEAIIRADYRCQGCGRFYGLQVHHRKRLADGGDPFDLSNLRVLCHRCHVKEHTGAILPDAKLARKLANFKRFARVVK